MPTAGTQSPAPPLRERVHKFLALHDKVAKAPVVRDADIQQLREIVVSTPELHFVADDVWRIRDQLLNLAAKGAAKAVMLARLDLLKGELGYAASSPIERMLIEHVLTCWTRLTHAERVYSSNVVQETLNPDVSRYFEELLSATQRRFLAAVESLVRVRRLGARSPLVQFNIAQSGGQQFNLQKACSEADGGEC